MSNRQPILHPTSRQNLARLWRLARRLRTRKPGEALNATRLAGELECSTKTVGRDLDFLRDLGHNIIYLDAQWSYAYVTPPRETWL